jgi:competence protein ComEC
LRSDVLGAPHHDARSGVNARTILLVNPNTVLISAGVDNAYGHPYGSAIKVYQQVAKHVFSTNVEGGVCLLTRRLGDDYETHLVRHYARIAAHA